MNIETKWQQLIENENAIQQVISSFPVDDSDEDNAIRVTIIAAALKWALQTSSKAISTAMLPLPRNTNSEVSISELEKRENFQAYQKWWFKTHPNTPLSMKHYMDWLEALKLLWEQLEE
ncbi:hypothetical protein [Pseudodesulfovibrio sp. zrk46]|uniref:hypothetical protein n=1 Tax=Pseudodesulfovibrio sp. zrk46 TaxID=2725288 RepID=UPI001448DA73|nr:hypothetical protein [Pseudodesulfovibrio sp. zrk46]QJB56637.1 hypothetical protein HFN16_09570 [Pseudodesulfovibrio sp. zrk46]